jgi:hypothetical protein
MPGFGREVASIAPCVSSAFPEGTEVGGAYRSPVPPPAPSVSSAAPESTERSGTYQSTLPPRTLSARFWGLDLCKGLPRVMSSDGVEAVRGELARVRDFLLCAFPSFTEEELGAQPDARMVDAKRLYLSTACDLVELRHEDRTVGVIVGAPEDWSSYYVRIFAVLPSYQRPGLTRRFGRECLFEPLAEHRVERVIAETSPTNLAMTRGLTEMHFHVTGHHLSERWGALVRYTKFLDPAREAAFQQRFVAALPK